MGSTKKKAQALAACASFSFLALMLTAEPGFS
jgi:hypothetical protein